MTLEFDGGARLDCDSLQQLAEVVDIFTSSIRSAQSEAEARTQAANVKMREAQMMLSACVDVPRLQAELQGAIAARDSALEIIKAMEEATR
jgi:hypothetical protein